MGNHVCHRDLKLENFMCTTMQPIEETQFKLIDFGTACICLEGQKLNGKVGTPRYQAPEMLKGKHEHDCSCDNWSSGVMMYNMLSGFYPFNNDSDVLLGRPSCVRGCQGVDPCQGKVWQRVSEDAKELVRALLVTNPAGRLTSHRALHD